MGLNFLLASVSFTLSHTLSLDSFCRPTTGQSSSSAGLFPQAAFGWRIHCGVEVTELMSTNTKLCFCKNNKRRIINNTLSPLVYAYVVDCATASPYAYFSSTHRFPDEQRDDVVYWYLIQ